MIGNPVMVKKGGESLTEKHFVFVDGPMGYSINTYVTGSAVSELVDMGGTYSGPNVEATDADGNSFDVNIEKGKTEVTLSFTMPNKSISIEVSESTIGGITPIV